MIKSLTKVLLDYQEKSKQKLLPGWKNGPLATSSSLTSRHSHCKYFARQKISAGESNLLYVSEENTNNKQSLAVKSVVTLAALRFFIVTVLK